MVETTLVSETYELIHDDGLLADVVGGGIVLTGPVTPGSYNVVIRRTTVQDFSQTIIVGPGPDMLQKAFVDRIRAGAEDLRFMVVGTSIGNAFDEYVRLMDERWAAVTTSYAVRNTLYSATAPSTGAYQAQAITGLTLGPTLFSDNFDRADGPMGTSSGGGAYGTVSAWNISGNHAVQTSFSNVLAPAADLPNDKHIIQIDYTKGNSTSDGARLYGLFSSTNSCAIFSIANNGVIALTYQPGGVQMSAYDTGPDLVTGESLQLKLIVDGDWLQGEVIRSGVTSKIAAKLTASQKASLTGRKFGIASLVNGSGAYFDNLAVCSIAQTRRLDVINASVPGASLAYHNSNWSSQIYAGPVDFILLDASHNEGADSVAVFQNNIDTLLATIRGSIANVPIAILMENPEISPAVNVAAHAARVESIPSYAATRGLGWINAYSGFNSAWINPSDGVHPTSPNGNGFIRDKVADSFGV